MMPWKSSFAIVAFLMMIHVTFCYQKRPSRSVFGPENRPPYLSNCRRGATEDEPCSDGQGVCVRPANTPEQCHSRLKCMPLPVSPFGATEFIFGFTANHFTSPPLSVYVVSKEAALVTLSVPLVSFTTTMNVASNVAAVFNMIQTYRTPSGSSIYPLGVHVTSSGPVSVYCEDRAVGSTDGTFTIPENKLSTEYVISSWNVGFSTTRATVAVVGTVDATQITLNFPSGDSITQIINRYELYHIISSSELTGTCVSATESVAVFAGHECSWVVTSGCDLMYDQMPPIEYLKTTYVAFYPFPRHRYFLRITALEDDTNIELSDSSTDVLNSKQFVQYEFDNTAIGIASDKPVMVAAYGLGRNADTSFGQNHDPAFVILIAIEHFRSSYIFYAPPDALATVLVITIPDDPSAIASLLLNNVLVDPDEATVVSVPFDGNYKVMYKTLEDDGVYEISADMSFGAYLIISRQQSETWMALSYIF